MDAHTDISGLVNQMTVEEKAALCLGSDIWHTRGIERLGIPAIMMSDGPHGLRKQPETGDHVGMFESLPATCFPTAAALGSSWDVHLLRRVGAALGLEAKAARVAVVLGPGINIKRSPLCGRNFEYLSEDPLVSGVLGAALVEGLQSQGVGASVKHYAANNQETDRVRVSADVDERTLHEIYLAAFEHVVTRARPWTVMCSYNKVNGTYASQHRWLLTTVLRERWGFDGLVVSDWGAVADRVAALEAGLDLEMPPRLGVSDAQIVAAVQAGALDEQVLDTAVGRVLTLVQRSLAGGEGVAVDLDAHHALARTAARECAVLLKNEGDLLPLELGPGQHVAVIGEFARTPRYQGAGSSQVNPTRLDTALEAMRTAVPEGVRVSFAAGFATGPAANGPDEAALTDEAVALAAEADTVVLFLGLPAGAESEGFDRRHMDLPADQVALVAKVAEVNPRLVAVLSNGSAVRVSTWEHQVPALLECWLSGQGGGSAVVDLLLGAANPSGKLAETIPLRLEDSPSFLNFPGEAGHVRYGEGVFVGYRGHDARGDAVSYPFGHGLSYTRFAYTDLRTRVSGRSAAGDLAVEVTCRVTNTGNRAGSEVVQLYVRDVEASVARPVRELKAFAKAALDPGQSIAMTFRLSSRDFSYWSVARHDWVLEAGEFELAVGASSRDLRLSETVDLAAPSLAPTLTADSTLEEWLADPVGRVALLTAMSGRTDAEPSGPAAPEELAVIGSFPLSRLAAFPGLAVAPAALDALVEAVRTRSGRA